MMGRQGAQPESGVEPRRPVLEKHVVAAGRHGDRPVFSVRPEHRSGRPVHLRAPAPGEAGPAHEVPGPVALDVEPLLVRAGGEALDGALATRGSSPRSTVARLEGDVTAGIEPG